MTGKIRRVVELSYTVPAFWQGSGLTPHFVSCQSKNEPFFHDGDVLMLWGGEDIATELYGESPRAGSARHPSERDRFELRWASAAIENGVPLIGICRGAQFLCALAGGRLFQDVTGHGGDHEMILETGEIIRVSSTHHQMMRPQGSHHTLLGWSKPRSAHYVVDSERGTPVQSAETEKEPEMVFFNHLPALAMQFHPEYFKPGERCFEVAHRYIRDYILEQKFL